MKVEIDISGQIQQLNLNSSLAFRSKDCQTKCVYLDSKTKKEVIKKYKGQVTNLIEKLHCILIYYCIRDDIKNIREIKICKDVSYRKIKMLLPLILKRLSKVESIKIKFREGNDPKSAEHNIALRGFRKKIFADIVIKKEMIENVLFEFKSK